VTTSSQPATQFPRNAADRLVIKLRTAWQNLSSCTDRVMQAATVAQQAAAEPRSLQEIRNWYEETTAQLLIDPLEQFLRLQPVKDALDAVSMHDPDIPASALNSRARIDGRFQRILIATALDLPEPWRIFRAGNNAAELQSWHKRREAHNKQASAVLDRYAQWAQKATGEEKKKDRAPRDPRSDVWWQQHRALLESLQLEMAWRNLTLIRFSTTEALISDVDREGMPMSTERQPCGGLRRVRDPIPLRTTALRSSPQRNDCADGRFRLNLRPTLSWENRRSCWWVVSVRGCAV
jgi:hypothetical protein